MTINLAREEMLTIVRKHSASLPAMGKDVDMRFWQQLLDMFFVAQESSHDDLLFFVRLASRKYENEEQEPPYFVRRWNSELSKVIGDSSSLVDWQKSFYLNLIAHTTYTLTVAICTVESLQKRIPWTPLYEVKKRVYASPSRTNVLTKSKASETIPSYPDIYFTVDDFDDTFQNLILSEDEHCYCVLLHASGGAAFGNSPVAETSDSVNNALFSGLVPYETVRAKFESSGIFGILPKSKEMKMRGPSNCGQVDVMLSRITDDASIPSDGKPGIGGLVLKAAKAAKQVYQAASSGGQTSDTLSLRCCLTSLSLPWNTLARDLLFKSS